MIRIPSPRPGSPGRALRRAGAIAVVSLVVSLGATAGPEVRGDEFPPVRSAAGPGWVNWTEMKLSATSEGRPEEGAYAARTVVEQKALAQLGPMMLDAARRVRISADTTAGDILESDSKLASLLDQDSSSWRVVETRYHTSGLVELEGALDVFSWLKPVLQSLESQEPSPQGTPSEYTGILVDARGLGVEPALAPRIWGPTGELLWGIRRLPAGTTKVRAPVGFVTDPADPRANRRGGDNPLLVRAASVKDRVDLVLEPADVPAFVQAALDPRILTEARVILVIDR